MQELAALASIVATLTVGVVSPGPSFVMVARVAVASSRSRALATALGMGAGGTVFGAAALLGLQSVLLAVPTLYEGLKVLGGLYLCYLGFLIFRSAKLPLAVVAGNGRGSSRPLHSFWAGRHNTGEQPEDSHRPCKRVRRFSARVLLSGVRCRAACSCAPC
jgi:threonine/homoserine/homoserine lactone efflux protein